MQYWTGFSRRLLFIRSRIFSNFVLPSQFKPEDPNNLILHRNRKTWHRIFFPNECKTIIWHVDVKAKNKNVGSRKQSLRIKQNLYSPNRFYFIFQHDDSWNFDKILNAVRKNNIYYFIKYMAFLFFGWL